MIICKVIGHVWATKKEETLTGAKLMVVKEEETNLKDGATFVAADVVGAGVGEQVLVVSGSTARRALGKDDIAVDCAIVGIIDTLEVEREKTNNKRAARKTYTRKQEKKINIDESELEESPDKNGIPTRYRTDDIIKLQDSKDEEEE